MCEKTETLVDLGICELEGWWRLPYYPFLRALKCHYEAGYIIRGTIVGAGGWELQLSFSRGTFFIT